MTNHSPPPARDAHLHAWVDGRLSRAEAQALEAELASQPQRLQAALAWRAQRDALRQMEADRPGQSLPPAMAQAAKRLDAAQLQSQRMLRLGGMAAGLVLAFGLGWTVRGPSEVPDIAAQRPAGGHPQVEPARQFARQAAVAHAVYQPEQRHPVEVGADQEAHLVQWLSKRLGRSLKLPDLQAQGYALVGGRLLPGDEGARAQFMYQNPQGERVTLYLGALPSSGAETAFRFHAEGPVPAFYWVDQGFGYALSGPLSRQALLGLATAVHRQL